jgi:hypothetical protein
MKVLPTQNGDVAVAQTADFSSADEATTASFKAALAQASSTGGTTAGTDVSTPAASADLPDGVKLRKGETAEKVDGHAYVEITSGDREGMFINTSGNVRNGQAFVLVRKHGKEYHIYGTGKDRLVVGFHMPTTKPADGTGTTTDKPAADLSDIKLRKGEKIEPVEGHAYAEITSGPRSGMYINTSGNSRRGEAFVLVEKDDFDYHIYGSGADRQVIRAAKRDDDDK